MAKSELGICWPLFDRYVDFGSAFKEKFKFSIRFEKVGKICVKSACVEQFQNPTKMSGLSYACNVHVTISPCVI